MHAKLLSSLVQCVEDATECHANDQNHAKTSAMGFSSNYGL